MDLCLRFLGFNKKHHQMSSLSVSRLNHKQGPLKTPRFRCILYQFGSVVYVKCLIYRIQDISDVRLIPCLEICQTMLMIFEDFHY